MKVGQQKLRWKADIEDTAERTVAATGRGLGSLMGLVIGKTKNKNYFKNLYIISWFYTIVIMLFIKLLSKNSIKTFS